jgi:Berberine and berberine like
MKPFLAEIRYVNYLDHDEAGDPAASAYGANYGRLRELKAKYDPENFFQRTSTSARGGVLIRSPKNGAAFSSFQRGTVARARCTGGAAPHARGPARLDRVPANRHGSFVNSISPGIMAC